jgi:hypothetical protein
MGWSGLRGGGRCLCCASAEGRDGGKGNAGGKHNEFMHE